MPKTASYWIEKLALLPHPEGGFYRQTYAAELILPVSGLPPEFTGPRPASTAICFLLRTQDFSAFHRIRSDELWHFYAGSPLAVHSIGPRGEYREMLLGDDPEAGQQFQGVVRAGSWFGSALAGSGDYALVGCTVAPGFDFADFELANRTDLVRQFPQYRSLIERLTRQDPEGGSGSSGKGR
ncbi:MAG: cupin domain-containing protein [Acidobacteriaceae bacterium]